VIEIALEIGGIAASIATRDEAMVGLIRDRYKGFIADRRVDWRPSRTSSWSAPAPTTASACGGTTSSARSTSAGARAG
jgi:hypothetical protein